MANLIICCDGTWNNPEQEDNGVPAPTNVVKLYHALADSTADGSTQHAYYHPGLGGEDSGLKDAVLDGALGISIKRHICSAYYWLAENYQANDKLYVFGFSRGAFTARSLCGLLQYGLLDFSGISEEQRWDKTHRLYEHYKDHDHSYDKNNLLHNGAPFDVDFLGVWDTVGALGIPNDLEFLNLLDNPDRWRFHDTELGSNVKVARHAMALDEIRSSFTVTRWHNVATHIDAVEKWFPGVHSDVGGGYADTGLSDIALKWMIEQAEANGLVFRDNILSQLAPCPSGVLHNSYKGVFSKLRSRPRNVEQVSAANEALFHSSVFDRQSTSPIEHPRYWPSRTLAVNESVTVDVFANKHWNNTYVYLQKGETYTFSATGKWQDSKDTCDWKGTEDGHLTTGDIVRSLSSLWGITERKYKQLTHNRSTDFWGTKRVEKLRWFIAVGCIANDSGEGTAVNNDGSPCPHRYFSLPAHSDNAHPLLVNESGYFYAFPNDVWSLYNNNHGSIKLTITRIS